MDLFSLVFIAVGLSMDSFAVSVANGLSGRIVSLSKAVAVSLVFAVTQGVMPVLGWMAGISIKTYVEAFDHWIAFGLLLFIGIRMILETVKAESEGEKVNLKRRTVFLQALATSIDALAVGIGFAVMDISIVTASSVIAVSTFVFSLSGIYLGRFLGGKIRKPAAIAGGVVLILIGVKILAEHMI